MKALLWVRGLRGLAVAVVVAALGGVAAAPALAADNTTDIVGGTTAAPGEFPWMVHLSMGCGGALFTPSLVLTAAHCFEVNDPDDPNPPPPVSGGTSVQVVAEAVDLQDPNRTIRTGNYVKIADGYTGALSGHDWALLRLDSPIFAVPVLKIASDASFQNGTFSVMGWGSTSSGGSSQRYLRKAAVDFISDDVCASSGGAYSSLVTAEHICAGNYVSGGVDTCQGDSGGPMVKLDGAGQWVQVGITSWGIGCGVKQQPGVYTEVNRFAADICAAANTLGGCPAIAINVPPNFTCPLGAGFFIILTASGGAQPYTWSIAGLPPGLSFNTATGQISGFLSQAGNYFVSYSVSDGMNPPVGNGFFLTVTQPVPNLSGMTLAGATSALQSVGLVRGSVGSITVWDSSDGGKVMGQSPSAGTQVVVGSAVNITVGRWGGANR